MCLGLRLLVIADVSFLKTFCSKKLAQQKNDISIGGSSEKCAETTEEGQESATAIEGNSVTKDAATSVTKDAATSVTEDAATSVTEDAAAKEQPAASSEGRATVQKEDSTECVLLSFFS